MPPGQIPIPFAAAPPATPAPAPAPKPAPRRQYTTDACDCRHAEGPYCAALTRDGGAPIAYHLARGGAQEGCPGHTPKRPR